MCFLYYCILPVSVCVYPDYVKGYMYCIYVCMYVYVYIRTCVYYTVAISKASMYVYCKVSCFLASFSLACLLVVCSVFSLHFYYFSSHSCICRVGVISCGFSLYPFSHVVIYFQVFQFFVFVFTLKF